jgi:hypothetical protein
MDHVTHGNYQARLLRKFLTEWHQLRHVGAESDVTDDHDAELPAPTFHSSSLNAGALKKSNTPLESTRSPPRTPVFEEAAAIPHFFAQKPEKTAKNESNEDDDIPPIWTELLKQMQDARERKVLENVVSEWMALSIHSDDDEDDEKRGRPMMQCVDCGMYKRREKIGKTGMCLKCSRREDCGDLMQRQLAKDSPAGMASDMSDHHDQDDWDHPNLC